MFVDNDISASTISKKTRPAYKEMLDRVEAGEFQAIIAYSNSRLTRRPRELEDLIQLHERTGVLVRTIVSGDDDLSTADGRQTARLKAVIDAGEAEKIAERIRRQKKQYAEDGKPSQGRYRTFGYDRKWEVIDEEAELVREAYRRVTSGESMKSIATDWNSRGIETVGGGRWQGSHISDITKRVLYAGQRMHNGVIVAKSVVPVIIDQATFDAAQPLLKARLRPGDGKNARRYLLTGFVHCGTCFTGMGGDKNTPTTYRYRCLSGNGGCGKTTVAGARIDALVLAVIRQRMIAVGNPMDIRPARVNHTDEIARIDQDKEAVSKAIAAGDLTVKEGVAVVRELNSRLNRLTRELAVQAKDETSAFVGWETFVKSSLSQQKAIVGGVIDSVLVAPRSKGDPRWSPERVTLHMPDGRTIPGDAIRVTGINPLMLIDGFRPASS